MPREAADAIAGAYASDQLFYHAFRNEDRLDAYAKSVLVKTKTISQDDEDWDIHPAVAALRGVWDSLKSSKPAAVLTPVTEKPAVDSTALVPFLQASFKMSSGDRAKLVEKYENDYPGVGVCPLVLPSLQYLQIIKSQCSNRSWEWTPWRKIISETAAVKLYDKKKYSKPTDAWEYVAQCAGWGQDELEEVSASPFKVEKLLYVRGHAYGMLGCGHPHSWHEYIAQFIGLYSETPSEGYRMPKGEGSAGGRPSCHGGVLQASSKAQLPTMHSTQSSRSVMFSVVYSFARPKLPRRAKGSAKARSASRSPASRRANARGRVGTAGADKPGKGNVSLQWLPSWEVQVRRDVQVYSPLRQLLRGGPWLRGMQEALTIQFVCVPCASRAFTGLYSSCHVAC